MAKLYSSGLIVGRFQVLHFGHQKLIDTALEVCDRVLILVGSSQESKTERNPFDVKTRIKAIHKVYGPNVLTAPLPDLTDEHDISPKWGRYVIEQAKLHLGERPGVIVCGDDAQRNGWFEAKDIKNTAEIVIYRRELPISATQARLHMLKDERSEWYKMHDPALHPMYDELRAELLKCPFYAKKAKS